MLFVVAAAKNVPPQNPCLMRVTTLERVDFDDVAAELGSGETNQI